MIEVFEQNNRLRKLMQILISNTYWITGTELAQRIGVTDRTIRNDISLLKDIVSLYNGKIKSSRGKGYLLEAVDKSHFNEWIYSDSNKNPILPEDRIRYLMIQLILSDKLIDLGELEDKLFISHTTLENDLKEVEQKCNIYSPKLRIIRQKNKIHINGDELAMRYALNELVLFRDNWIMQRSSYSGELLINPSDYEIISNCVLSTFQDFNVILEDKETANFISFLSIAQMRIKSGNGINNFESVDLYLNSKLTSLVNIIVGKIEERLATRFNYMERSTIIYYLSCKRVFQTDEMTNSEIIENIDRKYVVIVESLLNDIKNEYLLDLTYDEELFRGLVLHIKALVNRLNYSNKQRNPILIELKNNYPYIFELSMFFYKRFKQLFDMDLDDDDLSYISAHLGAAIERLESKFILDNFTVTVISHLNYSASHWLLTKLKSNFGTFVNIKGPYSIFDKKAVISSNPSLILTTLPLGFPQNEDSTIVTISPLLDQKDIQTISSFLATTRREFIQPKLPDDIKLYFEKELFFTDLDTETPEETINLMSEKLSSKGYIPPEFLNYVLAREKMSSTSFVNGIAIPHPVEACSYKTVISVGILKRPIMWGENKVKCVFLLAIRDVDKKYLGRIFNLIVELTENKSRVQNVVKSNSFEQFIRLIS